MGKKRILVIEDDHQLNSVICDVMQKNWYDTYSAYDGNEAIRIAEQTQPDLIILDINLPGKSGIVVSRELSMFISMYEIPIFILSGAEIESIMEVVENLNVKDNHVFLKPVEMEKLLESVNEAFS